MVRRSSTSTGSARSNAADPAADNASDSGAGAGDPGVGAESNNDADPSDAQGTDAQGTSAQGTDAQGTDAQGPNVPSPAKRRKRGPNKPKPGTFVVETKARMKQEEIIKLLIAHAVTQLGADVANNMSLQVNVDGVCRPLGDVLPPGGTLQFGTAVKD
jgi:hypothetical protein